MGALWCCWGMSVGAVLLILLTSSAVNPGCRCVRYTSTYGKEWGVFSSPDYPHVYPAGIRCLLYAFQAPKDYIVHIFFKNFHLPTIIPDARNYGCGGGDYLKLFLHLEDEGVNELTPWNSLVCGKGNNESFFSSSRFLILQFHSGTELRGLSERTDLGFSGHFRFLNSSQFESNGRLVPGTKCDYQFLSANYTAAHGRFFSPNFPSTYPHNIKCTYHFHASLHERVKITFSSVVLQSGFYSCLNKTDMIRVLDGSSPNSPVISHICNTLKDYEIVSSGPHLQIEFIANSESPGNGFRGKFHFVKVQLDQQFGFDPVRFQAGHIYTELLNYGEDGLPQASTLVPQCNQAITSDAGRNGSFSSPHYPTPYPATHCRYDFVGHGKEHVQIVFTDFNLFRPEDRPSNNCAGADVLSVFVYSEGSLAKIDDFCGSTEPPTIMSNGHKLTLELKAPFSARYVRGFHALYYFVEDFGMRSGRQLAEYPCAFLFNSSRESNGTFRSPNYPGLYPRDTECHYFFHGVEAEHVEISFSHFHLIGSPPCSVNSDTLEFSNYMPADSQFNLYCGTLKAFEIISERKFFRVTFRSDGRSDGTGFEATYTFTDKVNLNVKRTLSNSTRLEINHQNVAFLSAMLLLTLLKVYFI